MQFSMKTKNLKKNARLTLVVDGPKDFIEKVETAIHSILAFPEPPPAAYFGKITAGVIPIGEPNKTPAKTNRLPKGPLLPVTDDDEATIKPEELAAAKEKISMRDDFSMGGRFEPVAPGEVEKLRPM